MIQFPEAFFFEGDKKRAIILLHAFTGTPNDHRLLGRFLNRHGYTVYAPKLKNHSSTEVLRLLETPIDEWYADGEAALDFMENRGYAKPVVLGLSLGGMLAIRLLEEKNNLRGGGCFCSPIMESRVEDSRVPANFLQYATYVWRHLDLSASEIENKKQAVKEKLPHLQREFDQFNRDTRHKLKHLKTPIFIADAGQDELVQSNTGELLKEAINQVLPNLPLTYKHYPTSGHAVTVGAEHKKLQEDLLTYLEQLDWNDKCEDE